MGRKDYRLEYELDFESTFQEVVGNILFNLKDFKRPFESTCLSPNGLWKEGEPLSYFSTIVRSEYAFIMMEHIVPRSGPDVGRIYFYNYSPEETVQFGEETWTFEGLIRAVERDLELMGARKRHQTQRTDGGNIIPFRKS
ncbi:hypothetical protein HYX14_05475 [Candidatus Woesearchaeota archaeon]|nr:hypothetical protein [Candidatus Woesearchaeota archaeon]